ncbi:T9SS type A sorting domain-containing protein [Emticicia sp. 21SJ11W-3]|uniref:T9SS type A sorting domain-containing protein n=1 Tax=Emticicia sp. 21SJ11W-3 TaxID=2916755 RepID=UPI0020A16C13|nr:T9SS type A sorting domain-containing protein [Emticicia sp. 21SJ11W-3]UTA66795.1 T9SS type A sorting domain-containing protein [Emticicia sp. 21SJ11W-3]
MRLSAFISFFLLAFCNLFAQQSMPAVPVVCHYIEENSFTEILPERLFSANARPATTATIEVTYVDFPETAKAAYEKAMSIWAGYLYSSQPIRIKATWTALNTGVLAVTGSTRIYKNFTGAPYTNLWYPVAMAEAISGRNLNDDEFEIEMKLNNGVNWSFNTDGRASAGRFDFTTVVLHEIAHGLGFSSSMKITNTTQGQYGQSGSNYIYDTFLQDSGRIKLTDATVYGNPSTDLKTALTSNALYFGLKNTAFANSLPRIYAPTTFSEGSSISHFDENTYPAGSDNSLMSPSVRTAEVNHKPGELLLRALQEMGWYIIDPDGYIINSVEPGQQLNVLIFPNPVADVITIAFPLSNSARDVSAELTDSKGVLINKIEGKSIISETYTLDLTNLPDGLYLLKIKDANRLITKKLIKRGT